MATHSIGGVGPINNYNLSPDIMELGKTPVAVVCSGTIMNVAKTLEVLETQGINVCSHRHSNFPGLIQVDSGIKANLQCDDVDTLAKYIQTQFSLLGLSTGYVIGNPVIDKDQTNAKVAQEMMDAAYTAAETNKIQFGNLRYFIYEKLDELSNGKVLVSLKSILIQNTILASKLSASLCKTGQNDNGYWNTDNFKKSSQTSMNSIGISNNLPMKYNKNNDKNLSSAKGKKIKALEENTILLDQLHVNKNRNAFEDAIYNKPVDGSAEDQMIKLKKKLHIEKSNQKVYADHDDVELERTDQYANWGSTRAV